MLEKLLPKTGRCKKLQDNNQFIDKYIAAVDDKAMGVASKTLGPLLDSRKDSSFYLAYGLMTIGAAVYGGVELIARVTEASVRGACNLAKEGVQRYHSMSSWQKAGVALLAASSLMMGACSDLDERYQLQEVPAFNHNVGYKQ